MTESQAFDDDILEAPTSVEDLNALIKKRGENSAVIQAALAKESASKLEAAKERAEAVKTPGQQNVLIDKMIAQYVTRRRKGLLGRFGRTIVLPDGVIKVYVVRKSVHLPADATPVINWLLNHRYGKKKLRVVYEIDKAALLSASPAYIRKLHPLGVWVGKNENISVRANSEAEPTVISHRRFPRFRHQ